MTYEEAQYWFNHNGATFEQEIEMTKLINEALRKQIPKKPVIYHDGNPLHLKAYECPVCGCQLVSKLDGWCRECGQKIDWEE